MSNALTLQGPLIVGALESDITGILEDVVHQFSDPLVFLRELIQNSIDAGTREIEITTEFDAEEFEGDDGLALITVEDWGSGMDRAIIDRQLCRLFSSTKYEDYTQIGQFGIGFVSVYAVDPDWVCVDTGRSGESWRVIFLPDRTFEVYRRSEPIDGTRVTVARRLSHDRYEAYNERASDVVRRWCSHVSLPIYFDGQDVREAFEIDSHCAVEHREPGTRIVAGLVATTQPECAFYNRGLLLKTTTDARWPHLKFKVDSRFLGHTLTRDDVVHDKGYERIDVILDDFANTTLPSKLIDKAVDAAERDDIDLLAELYPLLAALVRHAPDTVSGWLREPVFVAVGRDPLDLRTIRRFAKDGRIALTDAETNLARRVAEDHPVLVFANTDHASQLFEIKAPRVEARYALVEHDMQRHPEFEAALTSLFCNHAGFHPAFDYAFVETQKHVSALGSVDDGLAELKDLEPPRKQGTVTIVLDHPLTQACLEWAAHDAGTAALFWFAGTYPDHAPDACRATFDSWLRGAP